MYEEMLKNAGFSKEQAQIYSLLLKEGAQQARKIVSKLAIKRGLAYKVLDQLVKLNMVEKVEKQGKVTVFQPKHPNEIVEILENRKRDLNTATESIKAIVGQMSSDFNMISGKPNVQFFEGLEGVRQVLEDTLYTKEELISYVDLEVIEKYIKDINTWYVGEREKYQIKKRGLVLDTPFNRKFLENYHKTITENRILPIDSEPFSTIMHIYDDKVSYITFGESIIGVIITNPNIATMHKKLFEFTWNKSEVLK